MNHRRPHGLALRLVPFLLHLAVTASWADTTHLTVRVLANDAKLIGDAAGGARVIVRELVSGRILAEGVHRGGTGSTAKIIEQPHRRGEPLYDTENAASFECELDLRGPTWVEIEATAPLGFPHNQARASQTLMLLPGRDIEGDGIVLNLHGLIVNLLEPHPEARIEGGQSTRVRAGVKLLCTCPIYRGSLWEASDYEVVAEVWRADELLASAPLRVGDTHNVFEGEIVIPGPQAGDSPAVELRVLAGNASTHNFGLDRAVFKIDD